MTAKVTNGSKRITVSISPVPKFNELPIDVAMQMIYDRVVAVCEQNKILLSWKGNHSPLGREKIVDYDRKKQRYILFNVEMVQYAFEMLDDLYIPSRTYNKDQDSSELSKDITQYCKEFITNGDLIVAMLLKGYSAKFRKKGKSAYFKASLMRKARLGEAD